MQAYLRRSVINLLRDALRSIRLRAEAVPLKEDLSSDKGSPLEIAIAAEQYAHYREALKQLRPRDRELVIAHIEAQWSLGEIAGAFDMRTKSAARMAIVRALRRLTTKMAVGH